MRRIGDRAMTSAERQARMKHRVGVERAAATSALCSIMSAAKTLKEAREIAVTTLEHIAAIQAGEWDQKILDAQKHLRQLREESRAAS